MLTTLVREQMRVGDLAKTLATLRQNADLSRRQLEDVSGVSEETIKKIEYGRNHRPTPDTLKRLAAGLARNRAIGRIDQSAADEMLASLMQAADYIPPPTPDPPAEPVDADIVEQLREALAAEPEAMRWILSDLASTPPNQRASKIRFYRDMAVSTRQLVSNGN